MRIKFVNTALLSTLLVFASCSSRLAFAAPPTDACSLLTTAQVSEVLGVSLKSGERVVATSPTMCGWSGPGGPVNSKHVVASILTLDMFDHEKTPLKGIVETQAPGLGDDAHYMTTPGFGTGLSVKKRSFAFKIRVYGFSDDVLKQKEKTLAQEVLTKL
jgi:hypothetical protein